MSGSPNKLSQFWQELKRRKVVRVITVYAAAAFVILEAVDIIFPRMGFPDWTVTFVIFLIVIGFIITVILSWIFDINPEGGFEKTKSAQKAEEDEKPAISSSWKLASYVSFVVIIVLIIFNIIPRSSLFNGRSNPDRSIAVLPFRNDSPKEERMDFINGTMEQILNNLTKIEDLRVVSRTSVEQYRESTKSLKVIADEMDVGYLLEGSGQRDGNRIRITVQLLDARKDMHIWSQTYHRDIEDVFDLQSEVARLVAKDLEAVISHEADQNSDELTAERQAATVFYQRGLREMNRFYGNKSSRESIDKAEDLFHYSLDYDSTFLESYQQLAAVYLQKYWMRYGDQEVMLDSALVMAEIALQMGSQDAEDHYIIGRIQLIGGQEERARKAFEDALLFDPYNARATIRLVNIYLDTDVIKAMELLNKVLEHGLPSARLYEKLYALFRDYGFKELSRHYLDEKLTLNSDTLQYYYDQTIMELVLKDYQSMREYSLKALAMDSLARNQLEFMAVAYMFEGMYDSSLVYYRKNESLGRGAGIPQYMGYVMVQIGEVTEGERYINESLVTYEERLNLEQTKRVYRHLVELYAYKGEKEKAIEHFKTFAQQDGINIYELFFLNSPLLDNIRDEPEFQELVKELESIVQAKHDLIKQWLEENDML